MITNKFRIRPLGKDSCHHGSQCGGQLRPNKQHQQQHQQQTAPQLQREIDTAELLGMTASVMSVQWTKQSGLPSPTSTIWGREYNEAARACRRHTHCCACGRLAWEVAAKRQASICMSADMQCQSMATTGPSLTAHTRQMTIIKN